MPPMVELSAKQAAFSVGVSGAISQSKWVRSCLSKMRLAPETSNARSAIAKQMRPGAMKVTMASGSSVVSDDEAITNSSR